MKVKLKGALKRPNIAENWNEVISGYKWKGKE